MTSGKKMTSRKKSTSTLQTMRTLQSTTSSASASWLMLAHMMLITNLAIRAYALDMDTLLFETNSTSTADSLTRFRFDTPPSTSGQGQASSPLYAFVKNSIQSHVCNLTLGINNIPAAWSQEKAWGSYPQGTLYVGAQDKNHTDPISCVINFIEHKRALESKLGLTILAVSSSVILFIVLSMISCTLVKNTISLTSPCARQSKNKKSSTIESTEHPPATPPELEKTLYKNRNLIARFRDFISREPDSAHSVLLESVDKNGSRYH